MNPFQISVPLPVGPLLVEASAGTGKTWSIARLFTRLLAEDPSEGGPPPTIDQVLVVTFTTAATAELRDRIRAYLLAATAVLDAAIMGETGKPADPALALLVGEQSPAGWGIRSAGVLLSRHRRLAAAVRDFDLAAISTIHGFCQRVLQQLAFESGAAFDGTLVEDTGPLVQEIVDDWLHFMLVPASDPLCEWLLSPAGAGLERSRMIEVAHRRIQARSNPVLPAVVYDWRSELVRRAGVAANLAERLAGVEGEQVMALFQAGVSDKHLKAAYYKPTAIGGRRAALDQWLRNGALPRVGEPGAEPLRCFCPRWIASFGVNKGGVVPVHPLLDAFDALGAGLGAPVTDGILTEFAAYVVHDFGSRMDALHQQGFDDLLEQVRVGVSQGELVGELRRKFRVALIDEFQDTDSTQWHIFRSIFLDDPAGRLILIGDPKQAIYGFRGADVAVYSQAKLAIPSARQFTMTTNFRTDQPLLTAIEHILGQKPNVFLNSNISFVPVRGQHADSRLGNGLGVPASPLSIRWFDGTHTGADSSALSNTDAEAFLAEQIAGDVARELGSRQLRHSPAGDGSSGTSTPPSAQPVSPRDIAVLTYSNSAAAAVHGALIAVGIPAVISQSGSVLASPEAGWIGAWLDALDVGDDASARRFAVTPLGGWTFADLFAERTAN